MDRDTYYPYNTPVGRMTIAANGQAITQAAFGDVELAGERRPTALTNDAANQLQEYFAGKRRAFNLALQPAGSEFQKRIWDTLLSIPYGQTRTCEQIAASAGSPGSGRAAGTANNRNPIAIFIPSHRVLGANGKPTGTPAARRIKEFLVNLEREHG